MIIGSIGGLGISSYILTRTSSRDGETPPVDAVAGVDPSQQGSEEIDWVQASSVLSSSGAVVQRLALMLGRPELAAQSSSDPQSRQESLRRSAENAGRPHDWNPAASDDSTQESPRPDPISRLVDVITARAQGIASEQQWTGPRLTLLAENLQRFRGDVRQAAQSLNSQTSRRDDLIERIDDAFARLRRSLQSDGQSEPQPGSGEDIDSVEDALTDSPIPPETLRAAFAAELANLRMTLAEQNGSEQSLSRGGAETLQIEQYRMMERQRLEQIRADRYQSQLNAVA